VATFAVFTALPQSKFTISKAFTSLTLISLLEQSAVMFIGSLPAFASAFGSFGRLEAFLASIDSAPPKDEFAPQQRMELATHYPQASNHGEAFKASETAINEPLLQISNATFKATTECSFQLKNINLSILPKSFIGMTGPSGCGKTLLIKVLLKRIPCIAGTCSILDVPTAYCSQTPWLCNGTIKETIVGQTEFDESWYKRVISACALEHDLEAIRDGDESVVGSQGSTLSGGQKQRLVSDKIDDLIVFSLMLSYAPDLDAE
jgi:ATP-binding cassette subfamily C (CFTR/MRP) protein 1